MTTITTVKAAPMFDLLNHGSPDDWYKIVFSIERATEQRLMFALKFGQSMQMAQ